MTVSIHQLLTTITTTFTMRAGLHLTIYGRLPARNRWQGPYLCFAHQISNRFWPFPTASNCTAVYGRKTIDDDRKFLQFATLLFVSNLQYPGVRPISTPHSTRLLSSLRSSAFLFTSDKYNVGREQLCIVNGTSSLSMVPPQDTRICWIDCQGNHCLQNTAAFLLPR